MESIFLFGYSFDQYGNDLGLLALRLAVGVIFLIHGTAKLKNGTADNFRLLGISETVAAVVVILGVGLLTQIFTLWLAIVMIGAIYFKTAKWQTPFTAMDKTGWEFDLILLAASLAILFLGSGLFSTSGLLWNFYGEENMFIPSEETIFIPKC